MSAQDVFDLMVIGGGINGAGIARDAVGRGLSVLLAEQHDLAQATSSASSKLIHGGLRYLEYYEFRLVREALKEREVLLAMAPHIIRPLSFVLPHEPHLRPAWMIRTGLFLYDHLGGRRRLPASSAVDLRRSPVGRPLADRLERGFIYSDCWVDDARLVALTARDAADRGACIRTRTRVEAAKRADGLWRVRLAEESGMRQEVTARGLVNAAGPWVSDMLSHIEGVRSQSNVRLIKGSHIVLPRLYEGEQAYILQNDDRRIVFVIPYEGRFTLVGTTDEPFQGDPASVRISAAETQYLCDVVSGHFAQAIDPADIVWSYAGVRPLHDDARLSASAVTRDYAFDVDGAPGEPPLLSVFGGKITIYRRLAEHALEKLAPFFPHLGPAWTETSSLPGGGFENADFVGFLDGFSRDHPWLPASLAERLARSYGTEAATIVGSARSLAELGRDFGLGLSERELGHLVAHEFARKAEDVLWRRSKLGLHLGAEAATELDAWLRGRTDSKTGGEAA
ncbi:MAG: glycerol-3-phosphate dehydrogenase [Proteobacteria bacterium]|nr:glycerol-3-phosphate dehydrogenase [Pseudomonadota bacterium]MBI3499122.1 glycerol-3-phosphate dehydrogenase [Pseudomonadota bacterium]